MAGCLFGAMNAAEQRRSYKAAAHCGVSAAKNKQKEAATAKCTKAACCFHLRHTSSITIPTAEGCESGALRPTRASQLASAPL